jgi:hypothetical protein
LLLHWVGVFDRRPANLDRLQKLHLKVPAIFAVAFTTFTG